jgi:hypothetical protein
VIVTSGFRATSMPSSYRTATPPARVWVIVRQLPRVGHGAAGTLSEAVVDDQPLIERGRRTGSRHDTHERRGDGQDDGTGRARAQRKGHADLLAVVK